MKNYLVRIINTIIIIIIFLAVFLANGFCSASGLLTKTLTFAPDDLVFSKSGDYDRISLKGCESTCRTGEPGLPVYLVQLVLPAGTSGEGIELVDIKSMNLAGDFLVRPVQPPRILLPLRRGEQELPFTEPDAAIYNSSKVYPSNIVEYIKTGHLGPYSIASFKVYPLQYIPGERHLVFHYKISFSVTYSDHKKFSGHEPSFSPLTSSCYREAVKRIVANPESIDYGVAPGISGAKGKGNETAYLVITDPDFVTSFQPLADWKTRKGLPAEVVSTSWIYSNYSGSDNQEKIRNYIRESFEKRGTAWVLLGGDTGKVPVRKAFAMDSAAGYDPDENNIPCDLYYACLDGTWNDNDNKEVFGEVDDNVDLLPDVFVGRAPVKSQDQAQSFVAKVIAYEKNPPQDYLPEVLFAAEVLWNDPFTDQGRAMDEIGEDFIPPGFNITKLYESKGNESHDSVMASLNQGMHLINHDGHAWYSVMSVGNGNLTRSDMDRLTNGPDNSIMFSIGCWPAALDKDCIAEHFVNNPNGGGVAFIGNSRYGWGAEGDPGFGYSDRFNRDFFRFLFHENEYHLGAALTLSKAFYVPFAQQENVYRWCEYEINLLGDPEMPVWTEKPGLMTVKFPGEIPVGTSVVPVTVLSGVEPVEDASVCLMKGDEVYSSALTDVSGRVKFTVSPVSPVGRLYVTVTAQNFLPYEGTIDVISDASYVAENGVVIDDHAGNGNGDGLLNPGESVSAIVSLKNFGNQDVRGVEAVLNPMSEGVLVTAGNVSYGDMASGEEIQPAGMFSFTVPGDLENGDIVSFNLSVSDSDMNQWNCVIPFQVATPLVVCKIEVVDDHAGGNGNNLAESSETVNLLVSVENRGLSDARDLDVALSSDDPLVVVDDTASHHSLLASGAKVVDSFTVTIDSSCPEPRFPVLLTDAVTGAGYAFHGELPFTIGTTGFSDDLENGEGSWSTPSADNVWHLSDHRFHSGVQSWYCGEEGSWVYSKNNSSTLISQPFYIGRNSVLSFWCWYDMAIYGVNGFYVELNDGSGWEKKDFIGSGGALNPVLMGNDWMEYTYDLSGYSPGTEMQLRFRFVSDDEPAAEGVYIDDIKVGPSTVSNGISFKRGDANSDMSVNLADAVYILSYLFSRGESPACYDSADTNDDGLIDISDAIYIILYLFQGMDDGPPLGECLSDLTEDNLDCAFYPCQK